MILTVAKMLINYVFIIHYVINWTYFHDLILRPLRMIQ